MVDDAAVCAGSLIVEARVRPRRVSRFTASVASGSVEVPEATFDGALARRVWPAEPPWRGVRLSLDARPRCAARARATL
jgi:hypothetical protein